MDAATKEKAKLSFDLIYNAQKNRVKPVKTINLDDPIPVKRDVFRKPKKVEEIPEPVKPSEKVEIVPEVKAVEPEKTSSHFSSSTKDLERVISQTNREINQEIFEAGQPLPKAGEKLLTEDDKKLQIAKEFARTMEIDLSQKEPVPDFKPKSSQFDIPRDAPLSNDNEELRISLRRKCLLIINNHRFDLRLSPLYQNDDKQKLILNLYKMNVNQLELLYDQMLLLIRGANGSKTLGPSSSCACCHGR